MTKVEELRKGVVSLVTIPSMFSHDPVDTEAVGLVDSLISAAQDEARAEGAEQERERIRKAADHYEAEDELPYAELVDGNYVGASCEIYVIPASVLAPAPKEEGK